MRFFGDYYKPARLLRYKVLSVFSKRTAFRYRMMCELSEWHENEYEYREIHKDACLIAVTDTVYLPISKSANTAMKYLIAEKCAPAEFLAGLKRQISEEIASEDNLIHFYTPTGVTRLRDLQITLNDLSAGTRRCFTVVRHPLDRFASAYRDKVASNRVTPLKKKLWAFMQRDEGTAITIDDLIAYVSELPILRIDKHVRPQWSCSGAGKIPLTMVGKVENLQSDVRAFADADLISNESADRLRVRNTTERSMSHELTKKQKSVLSNFYSRDFEVFDYCV